MDLTDSEKAGLSKAELEALAGEAEPGEGGAAAALAEIEDEGADKGAADKAAAEDAVLKAAADKEAPDKAAENKAAADKAPGVAAVEPAERGDFSATYHAEPVEDLETKLAEIRTKFEAGDMTLADYDTARDALRNQQVKAEISAEQRTQSVEQRWDWEIERFHEDMKGKGVDLRADEPLLKQVDLAVKVLAMDPDNENHTGRWFLEEGLKIAQARLGRIDTPKVAANEEPKTPEEKAAVAAAARASGRRPDLAAIPVTLGGAPAASASEVGTESEFSGIEKLTGLEFERALARLPPEAQERYARMEG